MPAVCVASHEPEDLLLNFGLKTVDCLHKNAVGLHCAQFDALFGAVLHDFVVSSLNL